MINGASGGWWLIQVDIVGDAHPSQDSSHHPDHYMNFHRGSLYETSICHCCWKRVHPYIAQKRNHKTGWCLKIWWHFHTPKWSMISCLGFVLEKMKHQNNMMTTAWPHIPRFPSRDQQDFVISFPRGDHSNPCHMAIGDWVCDPQTYICGVTPRLNQPRNNIYNACDLAMFPPLWCKQTLKHDRLPVSHSKSNEISDLTHGWLFAVKSQDIYLYFRMKAMNQSFSSTKKIKWTIQR